MKERMAGWWRVHTVLSLGDPRRRKNERDGPWQRRESEEGSSGAPSSGIAYAEGAANNAKALDSSVRA